MRYYYISIFEIRLKRYYLKFEGIVKRIKIYKIRINMPIFKGIYFKLGGSKK